MLYKALLTMIMSFSIVYTVDQVDSVIQQKQHELTELSAEVKEAQKSVGLAETMFYVEKIGRIEQLKNEIADLKKQK